MFKSLRRIAAALERIAIAHEAMSDSTETAEMFSFVKDAYGTQQAAMQEFVQNYNARLDSLIADAQRHIAECQAWQRQVDEDTASKLVN